VSVAASVHVLGIRHHGPGSARSVLAAIETIGPDAVLVEGPLDADAILPRLADPGVRPPAAVLVYASAQPRHSALYPFAEFSPEWQGIRWALAHRFAPNAQAETAGEGGGPPAADEGATPPIDPIGLLARAASHGDGELWWERQVEARRDASGQFEGILEAAPYGNNLETAAAAKLLEAVGQTSLPELTDLLPSARRLDDDAARQLLEALNGAHDAVVLVADAGKGEGWREVLAALGGDDAVHALLRGRALRLRPGTPRAAPGCYGSSRPCWGWSMTDPTSEEQRRQRWRLVLGKPAEDGQRIALEGEALATDQVLEGLHDAGERRAGLGGSAPRGGPLAGLAALGVPTFACTPELVPRPHGRGHPAPGTGPVVGTQRAGARLRAGVRRVLPPADSRSALVPLMLHPAYGQSTETRHSSTHARTIPLRPVGIRPRPRANWGTGKAGNVPMSATRSRPDSGRSAACVRHSIQFDIVQAIPLEGGTIHVPLVQVLPRDAVDLEVRKIPKRPAPPQVERFCNPSHFGPRIDGLVIRSKAVDVHR
jgi:hypothetical protein